MNATPMNISVPLRDDGHGGMRVGPTRVCFETIWRLHQQGASAAQIVHAFDTLELADVHAVLAWAMRHPGDVEDYLKRRDDEAAETRRRLEEAGITPTPEQSARLKEHLAARQQGRRDAALSDG